MNNLSEHFIEQVLFPEPDKPQWLAYLILKRRYPNLTYLSIDGYHCHGIADYSCGKNFYWQDNYMGGIVNWNDKSLLVRMKKDFCDITTEEIVNVWMKLCGETEESKSLWVRNLFERSLK